MLILDILKYFLLVILSIVGLYIVARVLFTAVFRSYFEQKQRTEDPSEKKKEEHK